jgi:hypothetical protein
VRLRDLLTDSEGQYDLGYFLWSVGVVVFLVLACVNWQRFDALTFGCGFGSILGAGGAMTWMRANGGVRQ